ncbi:MAG: glycosyltransferase family 4 protein [Verrucomicrobiota bacterium]
MKFFFLSGHAHLALDPASQRASGGAELQVALLARELVARGHQATILAADTGQPDGVVWEDITIRVGKRFDTGGLTDSLAALPAIARILGEERPDFVVVYGWTVWLYLLCQIRVLHRFRLIFVCALDAEIDGGFRGDNPVRGFLFERGLHLADARFGITEHQASLFREKGMSCAVTRLLLQQPEFYQGTDKPVDLLWVARCHRVKRPHLFLDLAERLPQAQCRMICSVQDEVLWKEVSHRAKAMANVEFLATVPYREIQGHFDAAAIFVNTSDSEGVPNTFIHSGLGHTAILSLMVDPDGMFQHFGAGGCAGDNFGRLVQQAKHLLENPLERAAAQDECARFVREWHDNPANVEAFLSALPS